MSKTLELLNWRYACKKMDPSKTVAADKVERILEAARLAPTSSGVQPFKIIVVTNPEVRAKIQAVAWNQAQITEGSHLLVFAAWDNYTADRIDAFYKLIVSERGGTNPLLQGYYENLKAIYTPRPAEVNYAHAARQAYIAFGCAILQAAEEQVDCTPMEGFDPDAVDEILGLRAQGLRSVTLLPLGYRDEKGDWLVNLKKVRKPMSELVEWVK